MLLYKINILVENYQSQLLFVVVRGCCIPVVAIGAGRPLRICKFRFVGYLPTHSGCFNILSDTYIIVKFNKMIKKEVFMKSERQVNQL